MLSITADNHVIKNIRYENFDFHCLSIKYNLKDRKNKMIIQITNNTVPIVLIIDIRL